MPADPSGSRDFASGTSNGPLPWRREVQSFAIPSRPAASLASAQKISGARNRFRLAGGP